MSRTSREIAAEAYQKLEELIEIMNEGAQQGVMINFALAQQPDKSQQIAMFDAYEKIKLGNQ